MLNVPTELKSIPKEFLSCVREHIRELKEVCNEIAVEVESKYYEDEIVTTVNKYVYSLKSTLYANLKMLDNYNSPDKFAICPMDKMIETLKEVEDIIYEEISVLLEKHEVKSRDRCFRVYFATMMELYKMTLKATTNKTKVKAIKVAGRV